jgi:hypothetical protein
VSLGAVPHVGDRARINDVALVPGDEADPTAIIVGREAREDLCEDVRWEAGHDLRRREGLAASGALVHDRSSPRSCLVARRRLKCLRFVSLGLGAF